RQLGAPAGVVELGQLVAGEATRGEATAAELALDLLAANDELLTSGGAVAPGTSAAERPGPMRAGRLGLGRYDEVEVALEQGAVPGQTADEGDVIACERRQVLRQLVAGAPL